MINKNLKYISVALLAISALSCKESYLDTKPVAQQMGSTFYLTQQAGEQAVITAYAQYNNVQLDMHLVMAPDVISDDAEAGGEYVNEVPSYENLNRLIMLPTAGEFETVYGSLFKSIYFANVALQYLPGILTVDKEADPAVINRLMAECKFIRALDYSYLVRYFGPVALVDHPLGADEYFQKNATLKQLYDFMEKDLKEAIAVLPERSAMTEIGRASKGAAKTLMAKNLLFESSYAKYYPGDERFAGMKERWAEALDYAEQVINSGQYALVGKDGGRFKCWRSPKANAYRFLFTSDGDNSSEGIYEIQNIIDGKGWAEARGNAICQFGSARRIVKADGSTDNSGYWGLDLPADGLVNEFEPGDPRLRAGIAIEGNGDSIEVQGGKRYLISFEKSVTKTYMTKYESSGKEFKDVGGPWHSAPMNIRLMRYADVLLMAAEAAVMLGQNDKALNYINQVRTRARLCGPDGNTVPANLTGTVTLNDIIHERRVELYLEGHRYFDLVRWNLAKKYLNHFTEDGYQVIYESPKHDFMPFPQKEINTNPNLKQNPGW
ncbi:MAG TPA: RagB/SusD family nutrient uptake outer membrane protein [Bacteroidales bacterium]|nr:RagB/SusD family nutrient uptake outer membrane protein [Bacteroidales bacterium]